MSYIGISEYVISVIHSGADHRYFGGFEADGQPTSTAILDEAKKYDDEDLLRDDLELLPLGQTYRILEIQRCPKCHKEFTEYPAISRDDYETEICPECGIREAMDAFMKAEGVEADA
jgi:hypothetical protein